ncbi:MAG: transporter substrate-binding domain-containing protein [bacterium]
MDFWGYRRASTLIASGASLLVALVLLLLLNGIWPGLRGHFGIPARRDLDQIVASDTLRVITRNHPLSYYLYRGTRRGFEFELLQRFAEEQGIHIEVVLPPTWNDMISWLYQGKGDVIAAQLTVTPERKRFVDFTNSYLQVQQVAVGTDEMPPPKSLEQLTGETVLVRRGSSYEERLRQLQRAGLDVRLDYLDETVEENDPVQLVAQGRYSLTVVDNTIARLEQHFYPGLQVGMTLSDPQDLAWAVRPNSPKLREALNDFLRRHERRTFFNVLKSRYFDDPDRFLKHRSAQLSLARRGRISDFDRYFREAGQTSGFDWRLLAAQSYHESRFRPNKVSWAGAVGLMQVMPRTAREMGIGNVWNPYQNIIAGARYMRRLYGLYGDAATEDDRLRMTLAAYNAGIGHISNARRLTSEWGGDSTSWNDVARSLSLLEKPEYYQKDSYAFVRGGTVRRYVVDVIDRYRIFCDLMPTEKDSLSTIVQKR